MTDTIKVISHLNLSLNINLKEDEPEIPYT